MVGVMKLYVFNPAGYHVNGDNCRIPNMIKTYFLRFMRVVNISDARTFTGAVLLAIVEHKMNSMLLIAPCDESAHHYIVGVTFLIERDPSQLMFTPPLGRKCHFENATKMEMPGYF